MLTPASSFHGLGYRSRGYRAGSSLRSCGSILLTYKQAELQSLSGWAVNTWSRFARQRVSEAFPLNYYPPWTPTSAPALTPAPAPARLWLRLRFNERSKPLASVPSAAGAARRVAAARRVVGGTAKFVGVGGMTSPPLTPPAATTTARCRRSCSSSRLGIFSHPPLPSWVW